MFATDEWPAKGLGTRTGFALAEAMKPSPALLLLLATCAPLWAGDRAAAPPPSSEARDEARFPLLERGSRGPAVSELQRQLNRFRWNAGRPPLAVDGIFGPLTELALRAFQSEVDLPVSARTERSTWLALAAVPEPREGRPERREARRRTALPASAPRSRAPSRSAAAPALPSPARLDGLERLQRLAIESARRELERGVCEIGGTNRGPRVDLYAQVAGMSSGRAWCGFFASFNYAQAARATGRRWVGQQALHSVGKVRAFFLYRSYTQRWTSERVARWEAIRRQHRTERSARRYMVLTGSSGERYARSRRLTCEVFAGYRDLPLRAGDYVVWSRGAGQGHIGLVESYDPAQGRLITIEGNTSNRVRRRSYDLRRADVRAGIDGFGRPALGDFVPSS